MSENQLLLASGTLTERLKQQTKYALYCGALQPIPTEYEFVEQDNIRFVVRILSNLSGKEQARKQQEKNIIVTGQDFNPFLPYEKDLFVADISTTHLCLLNKYNVVDYHLLIVTREFEEQESLLNLQDFQALGSCMGEFEGLAFYNGGKTAGASQRHKHLQVVPLPMIPSGEKIPWLIALFRNRIFAGSTKIEARGSAPTSTITLTPAAKPEERTFTAGPITMNAMIAQIMPMIPAEKLFTSISKPLFTLP